MNNHGRKGIRMVQNCYGEATRLAQRVSEPVGVAVIDLNEDVPAFYATSFTGLPEDLDPYDSTTCNMVAILAVCRAQQVGRRAVKEARR